MDIIKLASRDQEVALLQVLAERFDIKSNGAARLVFCVDRATLKECGFELDEDRDYVVKVALGLAGINQNNIESNAYRNEKDNVSLARIFYLGHYIEIMERVYEIMGYDLDTFRVYACRTYNSCEDFIEDVAGECENLSTDILEQVYDTISDLTYLFGQTNDNGQVGLNADGKVVAYDYGYDDYADEPLCSDLPDWNDFENSNTVQEYLNALIEIIDKENEALSDLENSWIGF